MSAGKFNRGSNNGTAKCDECGQLRQKANGQFAGGIFHCNPCWDKAGDDNAVADGYMTCDQFLAKHGEHSEYCEGHAPKRHILTAEERSRGGKAAIAARQVAA